MSNPLSIAVSPAIDKISLSPGEVYEGEFFVSSLDSGDDLIFSISIAPLNFKNEFYDLDFSNPGSLNQIIDWTSFEPEADMGRTEVNLFSDSSAKRYNSLSVQLNHLGARPIHYRITVPEDAPAGGQYLAFLVRGQSLDVDSNSDASEIAVKNNSQVAVLLYATVSGETRETGSILENKIQRFSLGSPVKASSLLENTGNVHLPATYVLHVVSFFSNEEVYTTEESPTENAVVPNTSLYSEQTWGDTPVLGLYRVSQEISFAGETNTSESLVIVSPLWFLLFVLAFILAVIYSLFERIFLRRRPKKSPQKSGKSLDLT